MPKLGFWDSEIPESHPKIPTFPPHLPHFTLQNPKIVFSRVSRQPPPRCSRGRGGGLEFTVICTGFAGWRRNTIGRDGRIRDKIVIIRQDIIITWQEIISTWQEMAAPLWYGDHNKEIRLPIAQKKHCKSFYNSKILLNFAPGSRQKSYVAPSKLCYDFFAKTLKFREVSVSFPSSFRQISVSSPSDLRHRNGNVTAM